MIELKKDIAEILKKFLRQPGVSDPHVMVALVDVLVASEDSRFVEYSEPRIPFPPEAARPVPEVEKKKRARRPTLNLPVDDFKEKFVNVETPERRHQIRRLGYDNGRLGDSGPADCPYIEGTWMQVEWEGARRVAETENPAERRQRYDDGRLALKGAMNPHVGDAMFAWEDGYEQGHQE
jgi:hypothetical protein